MRFKNAFLAGILLTGVLTGCTGTNPQTEAPSEEVKETEVSTRIFVDSAGREVEVPTEIKSIIPSGDMAQMFIWPLAADKLVTVSRTLTDDQKYYLGNATDGLSETGNLYKTGSKLNIEEVASVNPDIIIDFGEPKDTIVEDLDNLQELLGIPCVFIEGNLHDTASSYRMLGDLLGEKEKAEQLAQFVEEVVETTEKTLSEDNKKTVVVLNGSDGLGCIAKGTYFDEIWSLMMNNVAVTDESQMYAATGIDLEQLANWDPEYIFFYNSADPETLVDSAAWSQLSAVRNGKYYSIPSGPYSFVSPPSINRYLGMIYIAKTVYPDLFDWDLKEKVTEFYKLFYNYDLNDADYEKVMSSVS
jgi:iron complex transport system substrate-binding protein